MKLNTSPQKIEKIYSDYLQEISGVKFTAREIDVMSCVLHNRQEKKIASLLSIRPKTVSAHVFNIMTKLRYNNRDLIIDFAEKSGKMLYLRQHYLCIVIRSTFLKHLEKIGKAINRTQINCQLYSKIIDKKDKEDLLIDELFECLNLANIKLTDDQTDDQIDEAKYNIHILTESTDVTEIKENNRIKNNIKITNIALLFADAEILNLPDVKYIDFRYEGDFYLSALELIKIIIDKPEIDDVIQEFKKEYKALQELWATGSIKSIEGHQENTLSPKNKKLLAGFIICIALICILVIPNFIPKSQNISEIQEVNIEEINKQFAELSTKFISDNITDKKRKQQNYSLLNTAQELVSQLDNQEVFNYFTSKKLSDENLLNCLVVTHALAYHYNYDNHDGNTARELLFKVKQIAEQYLKNKNSLEIDFDNLSPEALYVELNIVKDLPQIYARICYMLGKSYVYYGDLHKSLKYYEIAHSIGEKTGIFEGHLSICSGVEFVLNADIEEAIINNDYNTAKEKLSEALDIVDYCINNDKEYVMNYRPNNDNPERVIPKNDNYAQIFSSEKIMKHYSRLILIEEDERVINEYIDKLTQLLFPEDNSSSFLVLSKEINQKMFSYVHNGLGNALFRIHKKSKEFNDIKFDSLVDKVKTYLISELGLDLSEVPSSQTRFYYLDVIESIFVMTEQKSRHNDFTKADSYDGLIRIYKEKLAQKNARTSKYQELEDKIKDLILKRDSINDKLKRGGWQTRHNEI